MQEIYFSQLKVLFLKDWKDYQSIFSDRIKFELFFDKINEFRADAHAKMLEEEDEAVLNVAFRFFEKALESF